MDMFVTVFKINGQFQGGGGGGTDQNFVRNTPSEGKIVTSTEQKKDLELLFR